MSKPEFIYGNSLIDLVEKGKLDPEAPPLFCLSTNNLFFGFEGKSVGNTTEVDKVYCYPMSRPYLQKNGKGGKMSYSIQKKKRNTFKSTPKKRVKTKSFRKKK